MVEEESARSDTVRFGADPGVAASAFRRFDYSGCGSWLYHDTC